MATWHDVERAEPEFAQRVRGLFEAHRHKTIATLRADGSPRISGIEAAFCDGDENPDGIHLTGTDVGRMAARAGVDRLVLTHIPAWNDPKVAYDEARAVWEGPLDLAQVGATYEL